MAYDKSIYEKAENEIKFRRLTAEKERDSKIRQIEKEIPEISEINAQLAATSIELSKVILRRGKDRVNEIGKIRERNLQGQQMIKDLLRSHGHPENYLEPQYSCSICSDTGIHDGERCSCFRMLLNKLAVDALNANANMPECDLEHFSLSYYPDQVNNDGINCREKMSEIFNACKEYADTFSLNSDSLIFFGKTGLGKTHLSLAIAKEIAEKGFSVAYGSIINYLRMIEKEHFGRSESSDTDTMQTLISADLLILDDLGSEFRTPFNESTIYNIINSRINLKLPTIVSTNIDPKELQNIYNDRIMSRIFGSFKSFAFVGTDIRQIKRLGNE